GRAPLLAACRRGRGRRRGRRGRLGHLPGGSAGDPDHGAARLAPYRRTARKVGNVDPLLAARAFQDFGHSGSSHLRSLSAWIFAMFAVSEFGNFLQISSNIARAFSLSREYMYADPRVNIIWSRLGESF